MTGHFREYLRNAVGEVEIADLCSELIRFRSINPPGGEREIAEYVGQVLDAAGLEVEMLRHSPSRASVLARLRGSGELPGLVYSGHLDVVPVGAEEWVQDPFGGVVSDGKVWGRGAADMKGGLAAIISAAKLVAASELSLRGDLILVITAGEEDTQLGAIAAAERLSAALVQAVVIGEPTSNAVQIAEKGVLRIRIVTSGKTAHSSTPELGENAIMMMLSVLQELDALNVQHDIDPLLGGFTRSVGTISGGVKDNVVPDHCEATVDFRTVPGQDNELIVRTVRDLISDLGEREPGLRADVEVTTDLNVVATPSDEPVVERFCGVVAEVTGVRPVPSGAMYATDAATLVPVLRAPMIIFGPGRAELAHQPNEYVEIDRVVEAAEIFFMAAARLLG